MRLVQKSLLHTGYFVSQSGDLFPSFTNDLINEAVLHPQKLNIKKMYKALSQEDLQLLCSQIKEYRKVHGIIPQNLTEFLRTGFFTNGGLKQSHNLFIYK